jgi:hypothetical protein
MKPLHTFILQPPYTTNLAYVVAVLVGATVVLRFRQYRLWEVALLVGLAGLANLAFRSLQDWLLVMLALGVPHLARLPHYLAQRYRLRAPSSRWRGIGGKPTRLLLRLEHSCKGVLNAPLFRWQWYWPVAAVGALAVLSLIPPVGRRMPVQDAARWPTAALNWMADHDIQGHVFSPPDYGAYVTWRLRHRAQSSVDTRGFFFPGELLEDSHYLPQLYGDWQPRLERVLAQGTDYFLLETTGPRGQLWHTLEPHIREPLYLDSQSVLLSSAQVRLATAQVVHGVEQPQASALAGE